MAKLIKVLSTILIILLVIMIPVNIVVRMFDNTISLLVAGNTFWELENEDESAVYFKGDYASQAERLAAGTALCYQVEAEGAALLLNNGALPLAAGAKVSTLSVNSVNLTYGGTGSGNVDASKADNLKVALEKSGFEVNATLWDWYGSKEAAKLMDEVSNGESAGESAVLAGQAPILEVDPANYPDDVKNSISNHGGTVIVTFSRVGGEGYDCSFPGYEGNANAINYLELNENERKLMQYAQDLKTAGKIDSIVVLINTSNALEVDFLNDYDVDACMWVGGLGITGTNAVTDILAGKVNPSGSLVDTYCYDNFTSPAMQNFVAHSYLIPDGAVASKDGKSYTIDGIELSKDILTYMVYQEGIYVGYKYYETRYADAVMGKGNAGDYADKYATEVAFPFGHGLSYTVFTYSEMKVEKGVNEYGEACYNVSVKVTNTGDVAGKETVQVYLSSPYTQYDIDNKIEKAAVQLIGFGKTAVLEAGASEVVTIQVDERDMAAYDAYGAGTYILDAGTYYLTAATDSHDANNNILAAKGYTIADGMDVEGKATLVYGMNVAELDTTTYSTSLNGTKIENQLQNADPNVYFGENTVKMLSRNDWAGTWPIGNYELILSAKMAKELDNRYNNGLPEYEQIKADYEAKTGRDFDKMPILGAEGDLSLYDMFEADGDNNGVPAYKQFDDPAWNDLLEQVTLDELISIGDCFHWRHPVPSVNAPGSRDENGPQGLTVSLFGGGLVTMDGESAEATAFTSEDVMAATFNLDLMYEIGQMIANDCIDASVSCLYGPGANTHRTPYGGRNFEYYSEDGFLAGEMGGTEVKALRSKGIDVVMKHFALNDSEQARLGQAAWLTEQAAREVYLKAFQKALEENEGHGGIMTAYTRWGTTWSGANYGLMSGILRGEWGNKSMHITDNMITANCNAIDSIMAGGVTCFDAMMSYATDDIKTATDDPVFVNAMLEAMHYNLYTIINSAAMNGVGPETTVKAVTPNIINTITYATIAIAVLAVLFFILRRKVK
ncbi:MAG: glycoside hydrolase family 3 C-terminal domain-containing protein [Clostridia bacterium]|nr:glycoside hydrolase family 3 C-terminal domain-containing protein [Clostridia bacterium]